MEAVTYNWMAGAMIITGVGVYAALKYGITAGYGRYTNTSLPGLSPQLAWFIQESPSFIIPFYYAFNSQNICGRYLNFLFCIHYFNRAFIFPFRLRSKTASPWYIVLSAVFFCCYNGLMQGGWNALHQPKDDSKVFYLIGTIVFCGGMFINHRADNILLKLRAPGETGYKIPRGFLYEYISCPNYFGEIIEWTGYAIAARSLPALAFAIFTFCNIGPRAISHHQWYLTKFPEYPKNRKALIPFIW